MNFFRPAPSTLPDPRESRSANLTGSAERLARLLYEGLGADIAVFDAETGEALVVSDLFRGANLESFRQWAKVTAGRESAEIVHTEGPLMFLGLPIVEWYGCVLVAVGAFVRRPSSDDGQDAASVAASLGMPCEEAQAWIACQTVWSEAALLRAANLVLAQVADRAQIDRLGDEVKNVSRNLATTYEEISLLYGVTKNLRISSSNEQLGQIALDWLLEVIPAEGAAIQYLPISADDDPRYEVPKDSPMLTSGDCPLDSESFQQLIEYVHLQRDSAPLVLNRNVTEGESWPLPAVRQIVVVPLAEGDNLFGWFAALNHVRDEEFGTIEASLMASVGNILGIHNGNIELYRQQARFTANVVKALTSAIDAKDPYTCGHSNRVARVAVRLAEALGCDQETVDKIYMAGLVHDVGKIGIDDNVLRKPGRLTDAEFEHIKLHPELGYKILVDLKQQMREVLPVVLHHHESWDGTGYPGKLAGEDIPFLARIVAVADAYDAMTSDRPYRNGMDDEKVDKIFRSGAGQQWDAQVIEAYFRVREDIRQISQSERESLHMAQQPAYS